MFEEWGQFGKRGHVWKVVGTFGKFEYFSKVETNEKIRKHFKTKDVLEDKYIFKKWEHLEIQNLIRRVNTVFGFDCKEFTVVDKAFEGTSERSDRPADRIQS